MKQTRIVAIVMVLLGAIAAHASQADWKKALEEQLNTEYPVTKVGMQVLAFNYNRITAPGGSYLIRVPGIYADLADTKQAIVKTNIVDGAAQQQKGFMASLANTHEARSLQKGEAVYILHERVKDDAVEFELLTQEATLRPSDGVPEDYSNRTTLSSLLRLLRKETEPRLTVLERFERELATEKATRLTNVEINSVFSLRLVTSLTSAAHPMSSAASRYCDGLDNPTLQTASRAVGTVACTHRTKLSSRVLPTIKRRWYCVWDS